MRSAASVLFSSAGGASIRHTPWLLAKVAVLLQAVDSREVVLLKISGHGNPANSLTKYTPRDEFDRDIRFLMNRAALPRDRVKAVVPDDQSSNAPSLVGFFSVLITRSLLSLRREHCCHPLIILDSY